MRTEFGKELREGGRRKHWAASYGNELRQWEADAAGSGSYLMASFSISRIEALFSAKMQCVNKLVSS
jgi:hypothetical protein